MMIKLKHMKRQIWIMLLGKRPTQKRVWMIYYLDQSQLFEEVEVSLQLLKNQYKNQNLLRNLFKSQSLNKLQRNLSKNLYLHLNPDQLHLQESKKRSQSQHHLLPLHHNRLLPKKFHLHPEIYSIDQII